MRRPHGFLVLSFLPLFIATFAHAFTPPHLWSRSGGGTGNDAVSGVALDPGGNVYVAGQFNGTVNFGGLDFTTVGGYDIYLVKYSPAGVHLWSKRFGGASNDYVNDIGADSFGFINLTGSFTGTLNLGGGNLISNAGSEDMYVARYTSDGAHVWSNRFGLGATEIPLDLAMDASGNIFVTGYFDGTSNFGGVNYLSAGGYDVFLAKYNSSGTHLWSRRYGGTSADLGYSVAPDGSNGVALFSYFISPTINFGGLNISNLGMIDVAIAKLNATTNVHLWSAGYGGTLEDYPFAIADDLAGNFIIAGSFEATANFGGINLVSAGSSDVYLAQYNSAGTHQWSKRMGSSGLDEARALAADGAGNVCVVGRFTNTVNFGGGALTDMGLGDAFIASYDNAGNHRWSRRAGNVDFDMGHDVDASANGNVAVVGQFYAQADLGGGNLPGLGSVDVFVVKYGGTSTEPVISDITDIGNDQGRTVRIDFSRSGQDDVDAASPVTSYEAYRRNDAPPSASAFAPGLTARQLLDLGWTHVATVAAHGRNAYSINAPTVGDSTIVLGQYLSVFRIRAATDEAAIFFDSSPDSGYSVDNLAPGIPDNLVYETGDLEWDESSAGDFDYFTVYGSNTDNFADAVIINYTISTAMDVSESPYVCYFVTATDFSGNEGKPAKVNTLSGAGDSPKSYVLSVSNVPNPFNPSTTIRYTVPSRGRVQVVVYDTRGSKVASLVEREHATGAYSVEWNGRADDGTPVGSGIYFARIEHDGATRTRKMLLLK